MHANFTEYYLVLAATVYANKPVMQMRSIPANQSRAVLFAIDAHMFFFVFFARPCQRATDGRYLVLFFLVYLVFVVAGLG